MSWPDSVREMRPPQVPSGLFPSRPPRPSYREPHPVRAGALVAGLGASALWMLLFGLLATSVPAYGWLTMVAGAVGWIVVLVLARYGDRGVATGAAISIGCAWAIATAVLVSVWAVSFS